MSPRLDPYSLAGAKLRERYTLEGFVGIGRFSAVYRGVDGQTRRPVAIRLLKVRTTLRAKQQAAVMKRLSGLVSAVEDVASRCPTLAGVLEAGAIVTPAGRWMPGVVQPWLAGETLEAVLQDERRRKASQRTLAETIEWLTPVADALSCAHAGGLVHGSVAPRNIFISGAPAVELLDLGIATTLAELQSSERAFAAPEEGPLSFFVPAYASPEHFSAVPAQRGLGTLTAAADVFSLALLLGELLTGRAPLGDGDDAQLEAVARDPSVRPTPREHGRDLGGPVEAIFARALAVDPTDRHATVESFWSALRAASRLTLRTRASVAPPTPTSVVPPAPDSVSPFPFPLTRTAATARTSAAPIAPASAAPPPPASASAPTLAEASIKRTAVLNPSPPPLPAVSITPAPRSPPARPPMRSGQFTEEDDLATGSIIAGKYAIERLLGRGGMGTVWLCRHVGLGERVAVKVMCHAMAADPDVRVRFEREARASARIKSRYVTRVYDIGELPDLRPYIVMEYMEGETLSQALQAKRTISLAETVKILGQVGRGLARAHELGIVHRDIKPDNVFLAHTADDGIVAKVFDFGIVKVSDTPTDGATRDGILVGTPHYMSPEQADCQPIDQRSDIYSLGVVAFRMMTGTRPFQGDTVLGVLVKVCGAPLPSLVEQAPWLPPSIDTWFRRACARDREQRFATVIECVDALASAAGIAEVEGLRDVSLLPPPPAPRAVVAEEMSCPTLMDDGPEGELSWSGKHPNATPADVAVARSSFRTNPLFGGGGEWAATGGDDSVAPQALEQARGDKGGRGRGASRSMLAAIAAATSIVAIAFTQGFSQIAAGDGKLSTPSLAPAPVTRLPLGPPPSMLNSAAAPVHPSAPVVPVVPAAPPVHPSAAASPIDAGPPRPPAPHAGRTRRAVSTPTR